MAPPKHRSAHRRAPPNFGELFKHFFDKKSEFAGEFRLRKVTTVEKVDEDKRAGTAVCVVGYEVEPLDAAFDMTEVGSDNAAFHARRARVDFAMAAASGDWVASGFRDDDGTTDEANTAGGAGGARTGGVGDLFGATDEDSPITDTDEEY
mmetsp:Transcript_15447/g.53660  ORF Transcript_15447/g.53660 Transcript_15447/m.53660 type:complete len:150 (-) Transcript_15447:59-508(-)